jgi:hypothetical protein
VNYSQLPGLRTTAMMALPVTAGIGVASRYLWMGIALAVVGGTLVTVAKFFPRLAVEPVPHRRGRHRFGMRLGMTVNGRPVGEPAAKPEAPPVPAQRQSNHDTIVLYRVRR